MEEVHQRRKRISNPDRWRFEKNVTSLQWSVGISAKSKSKFHKLVKTWRSLYNFSVFDIWRLVEGKSKETKLPSAPVSRAQSQKSAPAAPVRRHPLEASYDDEDDEFDLNCVDPLGRSALVIAIENENYELLTYLLDKGVKPKDALLHAIEEEYVEGVEVLLDFEESHHQPGMSYVSQRFEGIQWPWEYPTFWYFLANIA